MARISCRIIEPLERITPLQQPAGNVGGSLLVMNFAHEPGLRGTEDSFTALQDGRFGPLDIDLDQARQSVLPRNSVESDGFHFNSGSFGDGRVLDKDAPVHAGVKTGSLKAQTAISGRYCLRNNPYRVESIASDVFFDASNVRGIGFESKNRTLNPQIPYRN